MYEIDMLSPTEKMDREELASYKRGEKKIRTSRKIFGDKDVLFFLRKEQEAEDKKEEKASCEECSGSGKVECDQCEGTGKMDCSCS